MTFRILTDLERLVLRGLNRKVADISLTLIPVGIVVRNIDIHLVDRIFDRNLYPEDVSDVLSILNQKHLCILLYEINKQSNSFIKFTIQYGEEFFIHCTYTKTEHRGTIAFRTIVPYRPNYCCDNFNILIPR